MAYNSINVTTTLFFLIIISCFVSCQEIHFLSPSPFTSYTPSGASPGRRVYQVIANGDSNEVINYTIIGTDPANPNLFIINDTTGVITNTAPYPSSPNQYALILQAMGGEGGGSITGNLTINIVPSFVTIPRFEHNNYVTSIAENGSPNTPLIVTQAFSLSTTNNIVYSIVSGNTNGAFTISPTNGLISVSSPLDRETVSQYLLTVRYIDDEGSVDAQVQVLVGDLNDNAPQFGNSLYQFTITEDFSTFRLVGSMSATDSDQGINQLITYTLTGPYSNRFTVTTSGELRTAAALNYEELSQYSLVATARDSGTPQLSSTATVIIHVTNIDDECPIFSGSLYVRDIPYDFLSPPLIGDYVLTIQANDPDNAGDITYTILSGNQANVFNLDTTTGNVTLGRNEDTIRGQYDLVVSASDASCFNESRAQVQIGIGSANEHSPSIDESTCIATLTENPPNGTLVTKLVATDDDFGTNGIIRYEIVPNIGDYYLFNVDQSSGEVRTVRESGDYDRETRSEFQVGITATDGGFRQDFCILMITLLDENDNSPIFDLSEYNTTINNLNNVGSYIIQLQAQDMDYGANGDITYTLSTTDNCPFLIASATGVITVNASTLTPNLCSLNVTATDHGVNPHSNSTTVNLIILQSGHIPVFAQNNYTVTISERYSSIDDPIINVSATVQGGTHITYRINTGSEYRTNSEQNFIIVPSGSIYVDNAIDYERLYPGPYNIRLFVSANTDSNIFSLTTVTVNIININDERPEFINPNGEGAASITFDVVEGQPPGPIGIVRATDRDIGSFSIVHYRLFNYDQFGGNFSINEANGTIYSQVYGLDAESNGEAGYTLVVDAFNVGEEDRAAQIFVHIVIEDINDNPPSFQHSVYNIPLNETFLVGHQIVKLIATDPDRNDQDDLVYTILSGNDQATFQLQGNTLVLKRSLDYETTTQYSLTIQVSDGIYTDRTTVNIQVLNVDDEPPMFSQSVYYTSVVENSPVGTNVIRVNATDLDSSMIRFELKGLAAGRFVIDSTGLITVSGPIDREEFLPGEQIVFLAFAYGGSLSTADIVVNVSDINDYVPRFIFAPFYGIVPENTPPGMEGLYVTTVKAVDLDKDENGTLTYALISGEENGFSIDPFTGIIIANRTFDREATRFFMLVAMATDNGAVFQLSSTVEVLVEINDTNDNPPYWMYPYMYARVYENAPIGKVVIQLPVNDPDNGVNATVYFTLVSGNDNGKFNLSTETGQVTVADSLDYENLGERRYLLYFSIRDIGTPPLSSTEIGELEIHVLDDNDHSPQFNDIPSPLSLSISEDIPIGIVITTLTATDTDQGTNSQLNYTIDNDNEFSLSVHNNGSVSLVTMTTLDYETIPYYELILTATDNGYPPLSSHLYINISLIDINDEPPMFITQHFTASIYENMNTLPVSLIYTQATDPDTDSIPGGIIDRYELVSSDDTSNHFNYNNGWLTAVQSLDREQKSVYHFTVRAIDNDPTNPLSSTATITITVLDRNDNPSQDGGQLQVLIEARNAVFPAQELGKVYFIDLDDNDTFTNCQIVSGDDHIFSIDSSTCTLRSTVNNFPARVSYSAIVRGNDGVHDSVTTTVSIIMHTPSIIPPLSSLVTLTLNTSSEEYLNGIRSNFIATISSLLSVHSSQIISLSSQQGHYDQTNSVDITIVVMETDGTYRNTTSILQHLYLQRNSITLNSSPVLFSLPIDLCINEPCYNQGDCNTISTIHSTGTSRLTSKWFILFTPLITFSSQCTCLIGTTGSSCEINYDDCYSNPCQFGGTCIDGIQEFICQCPVGTGGKDCSINPNECLNDPCQNGATCINGFNEPICQCASGYYGNVCQYAYFSPPSFCDSSPCMNNGTCSSGRDSYTCICTSEYTGQYCHEVAQYQGGCVNNPCYNGSTCTENTNGYTCTCSIGFTGPNCRFPLNNCELEYCRNEGTCERGLYGSYNCLCPAGYGGQYCTDVLSLCYSSPCLNGGSCIGNTTHYSCNCPRQYYGDNCQYAVHPTDLCSSSPCNSDSSICSSGRDNYTCFCTDGAVGLHCSSVPINNPSPCDSNPCFHGGVCMINGTNSYNCTCPVGFTGVNCQINIDDCINDPCINDGTCADGVGHYTCTCAKGFGGRECQVYCPVGHDGENCQNDINYCTLTSCSNGGTCIEGIGTFTCTCPPQYTGHTCTTLNSCYINTCSNGGTCINSTSNGYICQCSDAMYHSSLCELTTVSFSGSANSVSYRAYQPLGYFARGEIEFEFATRSSNALLLLNTQHHFGRSNDFIAVEIKEGYLTIAYSLGGDVTTNLTVLSTSVEVTNGQWHTLLLEIKGKTIEATLDYCIELIDTTFSTLDCTSSVTSLTNYSALNLGLPLWLGGAPSTVFSSLPLSLSLGSDSCMRNVLIDRQLLDLQRYVDQERSQNGCPQIDNTCTGISCGEGTCIPQWNNYYCSCPQQVTGKHCSEDAQGLTFDGQTLAQYNLLTTSPLISEQRTKRQSSSSSSVSNRSNYRESVSLWFRTESDDGILFLIGNISTEHILAKLQGGRLIHTVNLGPVNNPTSISLSSNLHNGQWHHLNVSRIGHNSTVQIDHAQMNHAHSNSYITLEYSSNEFYIAGHRHDDETIADGYTGCIQDIRLDHTPLPVADSNNYASVTYVGGTPDEGCQVGPCYPNPCHTGNCSESTPNVFLCICLDGRTQTTPCEDGGSTDVLIGIVIAIAMGVFIAILIVVLIIGLVIISRYGKSRGKRYSLNDTPFGEGNNDRRGFEVHANVFAYDEEGGEEDTPIDNPLVGEDDPTTDSPHIVPKTNHKYSPSMSTLERDRHLDDTPTKLKTVAPLTTKPFIIHEPSDTPPTGTTPPVRGTPHTIHRPATPPRASTPDIDAFIEDRVDKANRYITDIDSVKDYSDEGMASSTGSLSVLSYSTSYDRYTFEQLVSAGVEFEHVAAILEPIYLDEEEEEEEEQETETETEEDMETVHVVEVVEVDGSEEWETTSDFGGSTEDNTSSQTLVS